MDKQKASTIGKILGVIGILFILAMVFGLLPINLALFLAIACFIVAGLVRRLARRHPSESGSGTSSTR
jgi:amino acid transporter